MQEITCRVPTYFGFPDFSSHSRMFFILFILLYLFYVYPLILCFMFILYFINRNFTHKQQLLVNEIFCEHNKRNFHDFYMPFKNHNLKIP